MIFMKNHAKLALWPIIPYWGMFTAVPICFLPFMTCVRYFMIWTNPNCLQWTLFTKCWSLSVVWVSWLCKSSMKITLIQCSKSPWSWWQSITIFLTTKTNLDKLAGLSSILILLDSHGCTNFLRSILTREYGHHDQSWQGNMAGLSPCTWRRIQPLERFRGARLGLNIDHRLEFRSGRWWAWCSGVRYRFLIEWKFIELNIPEKIDIE